MAVTMVGRRELLVAGLGVAGSLALAACGSAATAGAASTPQTVTKTLTATETVTHTVATAASTAAATAAPYMANMVIVTGGMIGKKGWPAFVPADLSVPAHATVTVRLVNFDDGTAPLPTSLATYAKVSGTVDGKASWAPLPKGEPNPTSGKETSYTALDVKDVSHTFTVPDLNVNVPIPASAIVTFTFDSGAPGTHTFKCLAPCGTGPDGMQGAMMTLGYMIGKLNVV